MIIKRHIFAVILLIVFLLASGCGVNEGPETSPAPEIQATPVPAPEAAPTPSPAPEPDPVAQQVSAMSVEQKVGQLLIAGIEGTNPGDDALVAVQDYQVGGMILFGRNVEGAAQLTGLTNDLKALNGDYVPLFLCVDQEGGRVDRMPAEVKRMPSAYAAGEAGEAETYGALLAEECAAFGFNLDFAPCLDIWSNPDNTVIGDRAFGTEWEGVSERAFDALGALRENGNVIPVVKHFPGHGDTSEDSHVELPVVNKTLDELWQSELVPFDMVLSGSFWGQIRSDPAPAVMVAHILMTALDPERPASLSPAVVSGLLREEMGFEGVVFTDDLTMGAISGTYGMGEACVLAVEAGCDALLVCHGADNLSAAREALLAAVADGRITEARLDESVTRILAVKMAYGLTNDPVDAPDLEALNTAISDFRMQFSS